MNRFLLRLILCLCGLSLALGTTALAQHVYDSVDVVGRVTDGLSHKAVPGATIVVNGPVHTTSTAQSDGSFDLALPVGSYVFEFSASGYDTLTERHVSLVAGRSLQISAELAKTTQLHEIGRVSVSSAQFNTTPASVRSINSAELTEYGFDGYRRDLEAIPGVTILKESQANDQRGQGNEYAGTPYGQSFVSLHGSLPYQTSVLFDDHRLNSVDREGFQFGTDVAILDPYAFDRIDVISGPGATSPTVNNAIGGTLDFVTSRIGSRPRQAFDVGYDGLGSTTYHLGYEGQTGNGRLGGKVDLTNTTTSFPLDYPTDKGYIVWGEATYNPISLAPGGPYVDAGTNGTPQLGGMQRPYIDPNWGDPTASAVCCLNLNTPVGGFRRSASMALRYDLSPRTSFSSLYTTTSQYAQDAYSLMQVPFNPTQFPKANYGIPIGTMLYSPLSVDAIPDDSYTNRGNQIAEFDLRSMDGNVALRASYLTESDKQHTFFDVFPSGAYQVYGDGTAADGSPLLFNGQTLYVGPAYNEVRDFGAVDITHDGLLDLVAPMGSSSLRVSFSDTFSTGTLNNQIVGNQTSATDPTSYNGYYPAPTGVFENFTTERLEYDANILPTLRSLTSLYVNQYHFRGEQEDSSGNQIGTADSTEAYTTPRLAFEYRPASAVAYRLSAGGALSPLDVSLYNNVGGAPQPNSATSPSFYTVAVAPAGLKPETSFGEDAGFDLRLPRQTTVSADLYNTAVSGQFYTSYQHIGTYLGLPLYTSQPGNLGRSRYYGLTLSLNHLPTRGLTWTLGGALQRAYAYDIPPSVYENPSAPTSPNNLGIVPNVNYDGYDNLTAIPYAQGRGTIGYRSARASAALGITYYGNNNSYYQPAFAALDVTGGWRIDRSTTLNLSVANLTGAYGQLRDDPNAYRLLPLAQSSATSPFQYGSNMVYRQVYGPPALSIVLRQAIGR